MMNQENKNGIFLCDGWDSRQPSRPSVTTQLKDFLRNNADILEKVGLPLMDKEKISLCAATGKGSTAITYGKFQECKQNGTTIIFASKIGEDIWEIYQVDNGEIQKAFETKFQPETPKDDNRLNISSSNSGGDSFLTKRYP